MGGLLGIQETPDIPQKVGINEFLIYCLCKLNVWYPAY